MGTERRARVTEIGWSEERGAERGAGGHGVGTERKAGVTEIGWSEERLFRRSRRSVHSAAESGEGGR